MITTEQRFSRERIVAGVIAGLSAGIVMAAALMIYCGAVGLGFLHPVQIMSGTFYGEDAILGGVGPTLVGLVTHLVGSAIFGVIFSALLPRTVTVGQAVGGGIAYGLAVWAFLTFIDLPLMNRIMSERINLMPGWWFASCLVFGACLGLTPYLFRNYGVAGMPGIRSTTATSRRAA